MAKGKSKKTLEDKIREFDGSFVEEVSLLTAEALKDRLAKLSGHEEEILDAKSNDDSLKEAKASYDAALDTYRVPLKANRLKRKFVVELLKARGSLG